MPTSFYARCLSCCLPITASVAGEGTIAITSASVRIASVGCEPPVSPNVCKCLFSQCFVHILFYSKVLHASLSVIPANQCISLIFLRVLKDFERNPSHFWDYCDIAFNSKVRKMLVLPTFFAHFVLF